ncbi:alpha/beta hydrolase [Actinosynnema pretiosum subsp. pretiosum]|uniref:Alpha/beta hydrolase fold protein n=2 Tax=Actinosynnema TaxID=40566 RepID=C6WK95_ACTMD|nr:alpha/beta hydrolase [Actinosynnema mirum]ACU38308.1 alpha/beta hydrolase fold protein [Actinosynnema mirum DSM 43827]AXX31830.1 Beta-ketoadipate enol-lactone hydrolase [Actinosynnema pretiosum subsp. pretiosum]QUF04180.1 alpha/beta hydrolase [Actinosynnema pretiosum subsp. pretiosum]
MTQHLTLDGGALAYDLTGDTGPLVVLAHGMGDSRAAYRFLAPLLVAAGHRVATVDLRGHGESSTGWPEHTRTAIAGDLVALIRHLGGPAVLVGHSISGGAATIAAATAPELVTALVELTPFTRAQAFSLGDLAHPAYRRGMLALLGMAAFGSTGSWLRYLELAYPGPRPADWDARQAEIKAMLDEPGRMKALRAMGQGTPADAGAQLANVKCPVLVVQGELDPDWVSPRAEGEAVVADLPAGLGRLAVVEGAGHYPHVQFPERVADLVLEFLVTTRA